MSKNPLHWAQQSREYLSEVQIEFKKVTWPTQKETIASTVGVVFVVAVVGAGLFAVDSVLGWIMNAVFP